jgi:N-acetylmuramoyl-L-alanine amidase
MRNSRTRVLTFSPRVLIGVAIVVIAFLSLPKHASALVDVWIDPGHGAIQYIGGNHPGVYDPGALGANGTASPDEADMNWNLALYLQGYLTAYGYSTAMTRNNNGGIHDTLLTKQRSAVMRGERANDVGFRDTSQVVVSIHHDSVDDPTAIGSSTYWFPSSYRRLRYRDDASKQFAEAMHPFFIANVYAVLDSPLTRPCRKDLKTIEKSLFMIRDVVEPAVLCEVGLISNACQQNQLAQDGKQAVIAEGIAAGVSHFIFPSGGVPGFHLRNPAPTSASYGLASDIGPRLGAVVTRATSVLSSFSEGFEGATFPPTGWTLQTAGPPAPYTWGRATDTLIVQAGVGAALVAGVYAGTQDEWLISPMVRVGSTDHGLSFYWSGNHDYSYATNATCLVRPKGAGSWTTVWSLANEPTATPFIYRERVVDMTPFAGDSLQFAFRVAGVNGPDFGIDDVALGNFAPTAAPVNDHCAGAIELGSGNFDQSGVTVYANNDWDASTTSNPQPCVQEVLDGPDVVYQLHAQVGDSLFAQVTGQWNPGIYLLSDCGVPIPSCPAGAYPLDDSSPPYFRYQFTSAGTYFLVVDGPAGNSGPFRLQGTFKGTTTGVPFGGQPFGGFSLVASPNPSRGAVMFTGAVGLAGRGPVELVLFDLSGRRVRQFTDPASAGRFEIGWDGIAEGGQRVPSGVYFARLRQGGQEVRRMLIRVE